MHTGSATQPGGLIASGWHTAALVMRLIVDANPLGGLPLLGLGVDGIQWPQPVRPGDTIQVEMEVLDDSSVEIAADPRHREDEIHGAESARRGGVRRHSELLGAAQPATEQP